MASNIVNTVRLYDHLQLLGSPSNYNVVFPALARHSPRPPEPCGNDYPQYIITVIYHRPQLLSAIVPPNWTVQTVLFVNCYGTTKTPKLPQNRLPGPRGTRSECAQDSECLLKDRQRLRHSETHATEPTAVAPLKTLLVVA
jgi:hypothetical protein